MADDSCWTRTYGTGPYNATQYYGDIPCASGPNNPAFFDAQSQTASCCNNGDKCGAGSVCRRRTAADGVRRSDYYPETCTDPTFRATTCRQECRLTPNNDNNIVYVESLGVWACCGVTLIDGRNRTDCDRPQLDQVYDFGFTPDSFDGPYGAQYRAPYLTTVNTATTASSTATSTSTSPTSSSTASAEPKSSGLSTGAKAGIGVSVAVGIIALVAIMIFFVLKRRRNSNSAPSSGPLAAYRREEKDESFKQDVTARKENARLTEHEADDTSRRAELDGGHRTHELSA